MGRPKGSKNKHPRGALNLDTLAGLPKDLPTYFRLKAERDRLNAQIDDIKARVGKVNSALADFADFLKKEAETIAKEAAKR